MRQAKRRRLTGFRRRGRVRDHTSSSRWQHLFVKEIGERHRIQIAWLERAFRANTAIDLLQQLLVLKILIIRNAIAVPNSNAALPLVANFLLLLAIIQYNDLTASATAWFRLDHLLYDINPLEQPGPMRFLP